MTVTFESARLGDRLGEDALLGLADGRLVTVLVRLAETSPSSEPASWYLETGFGSCDREGLIFETLAAAETWIARQCGLAGVSLKQGPAAAGSDGQTAKGVEGSR